MTNKRVIIFTIFVFVCGFAAIHFWGKKQGPEAEVDADLESPIALVGEPAVAREIPLMDTSNEAVYADNPILQARPKEDREPQQVGQCQNASFNRTQWLKWRKGIASEYSKNPQAFMGLNQQNQPVGENKFVKVNQTLKACEPQLKNENLDLYQCFENLKNFSYISTLPGGGGRSMGFELSDKDYHQKVMSEDPDIFVIPDLVKNGLPMLANGQLDMNKINQYVVKSNTNPDPDYRAFMYRSRTVPNPPNSSVTRLLVLHMGPKFDKWVQFTLPEENSGKQERLIDFIALKRGADGEEPKIAFTQFWRNAQGKPVHQIDPASERKNFDSCYSCHPGGMRQLSPQPGSFGKEQAATLAFMNSRMESYGGKYDWRGAIHEEYYGPPRGARVGCATCHNNGESEYNPKVRRGPLNSFTAFSHIQHKMRVDLSMPPTTEFTFASLHSYKNMVDFIDQPAREQLRKKWIVKQAPPQLQLGYPDPTNMLADMNTAGFFGNFPKDLKKEHQFDFAKTSANLTTLLAERKKMESYLYDQYPLDTGYWFMQECP